MDIWIRGFEERYGPNAGPVCQLGQRRACFYVPMTVNDLGSYRPQIVCHASYMYAILTTLQTYCALTVKYLNTKCWSGQQFGLQPWREEHNQCFKLGTVFFRTGKVRKQVVLKLERRSETDEREKGNICNMCEAGVAVETSC